MITTDHDYIQLLQFNKTKLWSPLKKNFIINDNPKNHMIMKVIRGDDGDFVPSIDDKHNFKPEFLDYCVEQLGIAKNQNNAKILLENDEKIFFDSYLSFLGKYDLKPSRCKHFSEKHANGLINTNTLYEFLNENVEMKKKFARNNKLINLQSQPKKLRDRIINSYNEKTTKKPDLFKFFVKNKFNGFLRNPDSF